MNKAITVLFLFLSLLIFPACNRADKAFDKAYENKNYEKVLELSQNVLQKDFNSENLYRAMIANVNLNKLEDAATLALLYKYSYSERNTYKKAALSILLYNDKSIEGYLAGNELVSYYPNLSFSDFIQYYTLATEYEMNVAMSFYKSIMMDLTPTQQLMMLLAGEPYTIQIVSSLSDLLKETQNDDIYQSFLLLATKKIAPLDAVSDGQLIVTLASSTNTEPETELYIGDIFFKLGDIQSAKAHYLKAQDEFPLEAKARLTKLY